MKSLKLSHFSFSIIFITLLFSINNAVIFEKFSKWFVFGEHLDYVGLIAFLLFGLSFSISFFLLFAHRYFIKITAIILVIVSAASTYFIAKYNVAVDETMVMNTIYTDISEVSALLSIYMLPYLFFLIILPIFIIVKVKITFASPLKYLFKSLLAFILILGFGVSLVYLNFNSIHKAGNQSRSYIGYQLVPANVMVVFGGIIQDYLKPLYKKYKKPVEISGKIVKKEDLVVVLVIGESARQKNFSLYGYPKKTNPILEKKQGLHLLNGIARLGSTLYALPEILDKEGVKLPAITKKLGIDTHCFVNYTLYDNCEAVGEIEVKNCGNDGSCYDEDVIPLLKNNLKSYNSGSRLVVLHLGGGSHGPLYNSRYPKKFQKFNPQCLDADVINQCTIEQLYNSYDNTILYTDFVLGKILDTLDNSKVPFVFIYLSDHGESLRENDRIFHGMPPGIDLPPEQAQIPLIIKASMPIKISKRTEYKQPEVFDTILDLFNIETNVLNKEGVFIKK